MELNERDIEKKKRETYDFLRPYCVVIRSDDDLFCLSCIH